MSQHLPVNEVFETVQGEATFTGTPAVFVRLQGCAVGCPWCDTKHTWFVDSREVVPGHEMLLKKGDSAAYADLEIPDLVKTVSQFRAGHVVITGGEPCIHDLTELTRSLFMFGFRSQIETSGTQPIRCADGTFVTVSPKIGMPGGFEVRGDALGRANEIKMPIGKQNDVDLLLQLIEQHGLDRRKIWLQPLSQSAKATALCVEQATIHGWRISIQTHKYLGVR